MDEYTPYANMGLGMPSPQIGTEVQNPYYFGDIQPSDYYTDGYYDIVGYDPGADVYEPVQSGNTPWYNSPWAMAGANSIMGLIGNLLQAEASGQASQAQIDAMREAMGLSKDQYNQARQMIMPYYNQGLIYSAELANKMPWLISQPTMEGFQGSQEYQNSLLAAKNAKDLIDAQATATGMYSSGNRDLALQNKAQETAQQGYQNYLGNYWGNRNQVYNMLQPQVAAGQNAATGMGAQAMQLTSQMYPMYSNMGNAAGQNAASGTAGWADTINTFANNLSGAANQQIQMNQQQQLLNAFYGR